MMTMLLLILISLTCVCDAVDRSKFKTCEQSSFCKRNRRLSNPESETKAPQFQVLPETIRLATDSFSVDVDAGEGRALALEVTGLASGVMRVQFREKNASRERYEVKDSLIPFVKSKLVYRPKKQSISIGKQSKLTLQFQPFQLDFFNAAGAHVLSLNERRFFNWEFYRPRPSTLSEDPDGEWDEKFGTHEDKKPHGPSSVGMDVTFVNVHHVYGIPSHAANMSLPSTRGAEKRFDEPYRMYNLDVFEYELDNPMALYGHVPVMVGHGSAHSSGLFWLNAAEMWIDVDRTSRPGSVQTHWMSESGIIDFFLLPGPSPRDVTAQYAQLTGTGALPPRFALGYHQCKWNYRNEQEIAELDANFDAHEIPYDVSWLDIEHTDGKRYMTWDKTHFPTPKAMIDAVAAKGRRMVTIVDPHLKRDTGFALHQSAQKGGHYIRNRDGVEYDGWCWPGSSSWPDFTVPSVREWWASLFAYDSYIGSTPALFTWNDMNEPSVFNGPETTMHKDAIHLDGSEHRDVHNAYGMGIHMATAQGQIMRDPPAESRRPFVLSRAFFAGTQRFGAIWTGDNAAEWGHLRASTPMLLSLGMAGISFAGADVGGFFGNPDGELLARWYQLGAWQPFFRGHAHLDSKRREPWVFDEPYLSAMRDAVRLRYTLMPYLYQAFREAADAGTPIVRPLWFEFPSQAQFFEEEVSFLLGDALLVHPVVESGVSTVSLQLPANTRWYRLDTLAPVVAEGVVEEEAPLERGAPAWVRGGSIVPRQMRVRRSSTQQARDPLTLVVALDDAQQAQGRFYWDDGTSFEHEQGKFLKRLLRFKDGELQNAADEGTFQSHIDVERIVITGLKAPVSQVTDAQGRTLLHATQEHNVVVIRKPQVSMDQDWTISFK